MFFRKRVKPSNSKVINRYVATTETGEKIEYVTVKRDTPIPKSKLKKKSRFHFKWNH